MQARTQARRLLLPAEPLALGLLALLLLAAPASAVPDCFGAAARDPEQPCSNPALRLSARPGMARALVTPSYPCKGAGSSGNGSIRIDGALYVCAFGAPPEEATRTVALIGDSHAMAWRAAVAGAFKRLGWRGLDITRSHCAFSAAVRALGELDEDIGCVRFNYRVLDWLRAHPEVTGAVVAHQTGGTPYYPWAGLSAFKTETLGFRFAWEALPPSVEQVFAIRDNPANRNANAVDGCVRRARRAGVRPGPFCALPRREALRRDAFVSAVRADPDPRYALIDMTDYFCSKRRCFPVVGGALVTKDGRHLTRVFSASLGPYLARAIRAVVSPYRLPSGRRAGGARSGRAPESARGARRPARG